MCKCWQLMKHMILKLYLRNQTVEFSELITYIKIFKYLFQEKKFLNISTSREPSYYQKYNFINFFPNKFQLTL